MDKINLKYNRRKYRTIENEVFELNEPSVEISSRMQKVNSTNTTIEKLIEHELKYKRIPYTNSKNIIQHLEGRPDFVIPKYKIAVFCDGDFWHGKDFKEDQISNNTKFWNAKIQSNIKRDQIVNKVLNKQGWQVIRFWESEIKRDTIKCVEQIIEMIRNIDTTKNRKFSFIDLFSGIGGFRIPIDKLGGTCIGYSEINKKSIETYKLNFDSYPIDTEQHLGDITKIGKLENQTIDLVVGGVPCQAWSVAGKMKGFEDPRGRLWQDAIRVVELNKPKAFIFENVKGLADPRNKENLDLIITNLEAIGYDVPTPKLLNSYDFGVPQNRDRIFIIGFRKDIPLSTDFKYPLPINMDLKLVDILDDVEKKEITKKKIDANQLHGDKLPLSRNRFQKIDEFNDFFVFCDTRNGHSTIHSWDLIRTSKREKEICLTILKNRRKKKYGLKDGNPMSYSDLLDLISNLKEIELEKLVAKKILKKVEGKYEFQNSKNSAGINGIYRIYLPNSDIFSTLTATGTKDMIALKSIDGKDAEEYKNNFIKEIYRKKKFRPISSREAGRLQGFPDNFAVHPNEDIAKKQFGNAVSTPVIYNLVQEVLKTGIFKNESRAETRDIIEIQELV